MNKKKTFKIIGFLFLLLLLASMLISCPILCPECGGSGDCKKCNGHGWIYEGDHQVDCPKCDHGDCPKCGGSGRGF